MLNRGTTTMDAATFAEEIERRGCSLRAAADSDACTVHASGLAEWFDDLVGFAADALLRPRLDEAELDKLRQRIIADMLVELVDVEWLAGWLALRRLNQPVMALAHFRSARSAAQTPISQARADYWAGRAAEAAWLREAANAAGAPRWRCDACGAEHSAWKPDCAACGTMGRIGWSRN
jgi:hypothetical protein